MSKRGSVQLLLLSLRPRVTLGLGIGVAGALLLGLGLTQTEREFPLTAATGLGKVLHQSAWNRALAGDAEHSRWPWEDPSSAAQTTVPRLGLSAAVLKRADDTRDLSPSVAKLGAATVQKSVERIGDLAIGDRITVTSSDGSSQVYRITGRRVVDPHLAQEDRKPLSGGDLSLVTCSPLDPVVAGTLRLIIEAAKPTPTEPTPRPGAEQKL
jgi:hypothetical protein